MRLFGRIPLATAVLAIALFTAPHPAQAQASAFDAPPVGARVRVSRTGATPATGTVLSSANDSIVVGRADGGRESLAMKDLTGLEISHGRRRNVVVGTALGLALGSVGGVMLKQHGDRETTTYTQFKSTDPNNLYLQAAVGDARSISSTHTDHGKSAWIPIGAAAGAVGGTIVGYLWKERWRPAAIRRGEARVGFVPTTDQRRVALALSAHF